MATEDIKLANGETPLTWEDVGLMLVLAATVLIPAFLSYHVGYSNGYNDNSHNYYWITNDNQ